MTESCKFLKLQLSVEFIEFILLSYEKLYNKITRKVLV